MFVILISIFFSGQFSWGAESKISVGASFVKSFTVEEVRGFPQQIRIKNLRNSEQHQLEFKHTVSDQQPIVIQSINEKKETISHELFLAVSVVANTVQSIEVFSPMTSSSTIDKKMKPLCSLKNEGDFLVNPPSELESRLRLRNHSGKVFLDIKLGKYSNEKVNFSWKNCLRIQ